MRCRRILVKICSTERKRLPVKTTATTLSTAPRKLEIGLTPQLESRVVSPILDWNKSTQYTESTLKKKYELCCYKTSKVLNRKRKLQPTPAIGFYGHKLPVDKHYLLVPKYFIACRFRIGFECSGSFFTNFMVRWKSALALNLQCSRNSVARQNLLYNYILTDWLTGVGRKQWQWQWIRRVGLRIIFPAWG